MRFADEQTAHRAATWRRPVAIILDLGFVNLMAAVIYVALTAVGGVIGWADADEATERVLMANAGRAGGFLLAFLVVLTLTWT